MKWLKAAAGMPVLVAALLSISSWASSGSGADWQTYSEKLIFESKKLAKPVIINFHAAWCVPCIKLGRTTFNRSDFVLAAKDFTLIQVDLTERNDPHHETLIEKYKISGVPTIIFLDETGTERHDLRVEEYVTPRDFQHRMAKLIE